MLLGDHEKCPIFKRAPTSIVDRDGLMIVEELLDPGVYALVNEDAHSTICELAKSSTARTLCRVMDG